MNIIKRLVIDTPLERPARWVYGKVSGNGVPDSAIEWDLRTARDNAYVRSMLYYELRPHSNCIDVGAHAGAFLEQFYQFAPDGRHFAFEPIPDLADNLKPKFPKAEIHNCALSDHDGSAEFNYVPQFPAWSGLRPQPYPGSATPQKIPVTLRRLDDAIPQTVPISFLKIDVEGAELEVLRGATDLLQRCRPIVLFECARIHHVYYETTPQAVHQFFAKCGLGVFLMDQTGPLTETEFVAFYDASHASGYDRHAWGNYLAKPL